MPDFKTVFAQSSLSLNSDLVNSVISVVQYVYILERLIHF